MTKELSQSASPYLLAQADSPINWRPWGKEAFEYAAEKGMPIMVSLGYNSCHWCHQMAAGAFSDEVAAGILNRFFVAIKVDREEHPAVDQVFMAATQALTGAGGWPNTVFCTPAGKPFFAGGFFPAEPRDGMPSFRQVVVALTQAWQSRKAEVLATADTVVEKLAEQRGEGDLLAKVNPEHIEVSRLLYMLQLQFDSEHGGYGKAPKFPSPTVLDALLTSESQFYNDRALYTLDAMSRGGIFDQVGGGFHRYAVDEGWEVPHFEKMLIDNALLLTSYSLGWQRAIADDGTEQKERFEQVVRSTIEWLQDEMALPGGGFASSLDADSLAEDGTSTEGAYYLWTAQQFDEYLGKDSRFAQGVFHVTAGGNLPAGAHEPTDGTRRATLQFHGNPHPGRIANIREVLKAIRARRAKPNRDEKLVTGYQGLLIAGLVAAWQSFAEQSWLELAEQLAELVWREHWHAESNILHHHSLLVADERRLGPAGVLADYASLALGYLALAKASGNDCWLERAKVLVARCEQLFALPDGSYADAAEDGLLFAPAQRLDDEVVPSANSIMLKVLRQLAQETGEQSYAERADQVLTKLHRVLVYSPRFAGWALADLIAAQQG